MKQNFRIRILSGASVTNTSEIRAAAVMILLALKVSSFPSVASFQIQCMCYVAGRYTGNLSTRKNLKLLSWLLIFT
jgi:hypothetical protein